MFARGKIVAEQIVEIGVQMALCHHTAVFAFERTAGGIAGVGEELLFACLAFGIEALERLPRHKHFAPNFKPRGIATIGYQHQWYARNGPHIGRNIVAPHAVAARQGTHQLPFFIKEGDAQPIVFQLTAHLKILAIQARSNAFIPFVHVLTIVRVAQREHRVLVGHLHKVGREVAPHSLCGRVGVEALRMLCL